MSKTPVLDAAMNRVKTIRQELAEHPEACEEWKIVMKHLITTCRGAVRSTNIQKIFVNEAKRTVAVKFDNGDVMTSTCAKEDTFSVEVGIAMAISSYYCGGKKIFHSMVERASKQVKKPEQEVSVKPTQKKKSSKRVILNEGK